MTFKFNVGFEVNDVNITIEADSLEKAKEKVITKLYDGLDLSGGTSITNWWVSDVEEDKDERPV